jgi:hypothetical protein
MFRYFQPFVIEHTVYGESCNTSRSIMNKTESDRIHELCSLIATERDRSKFLALVEELNKLLSAKDRRLQEKSQNDQSGP